MALRDKAEEAVAVEETINNIVLNGGPVPYHSPLFFSKVYKIISIDTTEQADSNIQFSC